MTGVFSADSKPAAEGRRWVVVGVGVVSAASESRADRERVRLLLLHQQMEATVIKSIFTLS